mmetsp:Transcript_4349/g.10184  ORF Transcript_4349/g.10184 Transcript_4349/m.10184 type:complete len:1294 (+) Transcript_4349:125-4006(+)
METGVLDSLRQYDAERLDAAGSNNNSTTFITREEGSNVDILTTTTDGSEFALCHLSGLFPFSGFTIGDYTPWKPAFEDTAAVALAAHQLNVGDGSIVPEIEGLNERCPVRFTLEFTDTEFEAQTTMNHVLEQVNREEGAALRRPCAFLGAYGSALSVPVSIVTGLFGYPQVSGASTSTDLNSRSNHPLFARTVPSDAGNAIPVIKYFEKRLKISRLAVIYQNDPYGNAFLRGLNDAVQTYAPDMVLDPILLNDGEGSIASAISNLKETGVHFVFCLVFSVHDDLMLEAYNQGVAGNGEYGWFFGDSFLGTLNDRSFEQDSPLHLAYQGSGLLEVAGGVQGLSQYDKFLSQLEKLKNPEDLQYIGSLFPKHDAPEYGQTPPFIDNDDFLSVPITSSFAAFMYEATIALGLSACNAISGNMTLSGKEHYNALFSSSFTGITGDVVLESSTGTRRADTTIYKVVNYVAETQADTGLIRFKTSDTDLYQGAAWLKLRDFVFNDGTSEIPQDVLPPSPAPTLAPAPPAENEPTTVPLAVVIPGVLLTLFLLFLYILKRFARRRKKKMDSAWQIQKQELIFDDPPAVLGKGEFGYVLQAEYRGQAVAIKRIMSSYKRKARASEKEAAGHWHDSMDGSSSLGESDTADSLEDENYANIGMKPVSDSGFLARRLSMTGQRTEDSSNVILINSQRRSMVLNLTKRNTRVQGVMEEMRHLAKLRHDCVASVIGAIIEPGIEPMLVMEYMNHGSLSDLLRNETMYIEASTLLNVLWDIAQGMRFLHSAKPQVIHGDLKSANVLMDAGFRAKIADFGLKDDGCSGTPYWMAPELLRGETSNNPATDVYSFGVVLYEVYSRKDPYEGEDPARVLHHIVDKKVQKRPPKQGNMPPPIQSLMGDCLKADGEHRPGFDEIDVRLRRLDANTIRVEEKDRMTSFYDAGGAAAQISLSDIFPLHIAEALRAGRPVEPEHRDEVTIFFSDIVGFTDISATLPARKVATMLGRLYTKFDELSLKYDIFKVETIGDAYMAVTNLVKDQPRDHAKRIAEFAVDAIQSAKETLVDEDDPSKGYVNIRVGFHSGPVVADVVGTRNLRYTLFGDTVNTASRMESNSKVNRIHCSSEAADILVKQYPEIPIRSRGLIAIKGKGEMHTYWVNEQGRRHSNANELDHGSSMMRGSLSRDKSFLDWATSHVPTSRRSTARSLPSRGSSFRGISSFRFSTSSNTSSNGSSRNFTLGGSPNGSSNNRKRASGRTSGDEGALQVGELGKLVEDDEECGYRSNDSMDDSDDEFASEKPSLTFTKTV